MFEEQTKFSNFTYVHKEVQEVIDKGTERLAELEMDEMQRADSIQRTPKGPPQTIAVEGN